VTQLVLEIDRVAKQADFNGTKLLDGSFTSQLFQVGANAGQAIAINSVVNAKADSLGAATFANGYTGTSLAAADKATADTTYSGLQISVTPPGGTATTVTINDFTVKAGESIARPPPPRSTTSWAKPASWPRSMPAWSAWPRSRTARPSPGRQCATRRPAPPPRPSPAWA
jgi:flagellin-like hook-associated protein FlgL